MASLAHGTSRRPDTLALSVCTGATFVHDWTAIATWTVVTGHILVALGNPGSLRSMLTGRMSRRWAEDHHPRWVEEDEARSERRPAS